MTGGKKESHENMKIINVYLIAITYVFFQVYMELLPKQSCGGLESKSQ